MKVFIWNIRGFARRGRRNQLKDVLRINKVDIIFLQETTRQDFTLAELDSLEVGDKFFWSWLPANGHSGGILVGFRYSVFEIGSTVKGSFLVATQVCVKASRFLFEFVGVYGPADHRRSGAFLAELEEIVTHAQYPVVVARDFNLIRGRANKNNRNIDWPRVNLFNDYIAHLHLSEVVRSGARFTWSNKQRNPVRCVLDRVLVSPVWETKFPLMSLSAEPSIGSDHTPLIFSSREDSSPRLSRFIFEKGWLVLPGFSDLLLHKWLEFGSV
jgi:endonuclease/exonuclease/phosphatase family metal-dependent hydrolase